MLPGCIFLMKQSSLQGERHEASGIRDLSRSDCFYSRRHDVKCHTDCAHRGGYQHCEYQLRPSNAGMLVGTPAGVTAAAAPGTIAERGFHYYFLGSLCPFGAKSLPKL